MLHLGELRMANDLIVKSEMLEDFQRFLLKPLEKILGGNIVVCNETSEIGKLLATRSGVDALLIQSGRVNGIGIRVLYDNNDRKFTFDRHCVTGVCTKYEHFFMRRAIGSFTSVFNVQAYIDRDRTCLLGAAVAKSDDIYCNIVVNEQTVSQKRCPQTYIVDWDTLRNNGVWIHEFKHNEETL